MKPLSQYRDIHSHTRQKAADGDTIVNIEPGEQMIPGGTYSVGIHPWSTSCPVTLNELKDLIKTARDPRVVAIGECGFDRLRGADIPTQKSIFDFQARLGQRLGKPLIIHAVKANDLLFEAIKRHRPDPGQWIIHGFRGNPESARQLLRAGFALSLGEKYNPAALQIIPSDRLYHESDS